MHLLQLHLVGIGSVLGRCGDSAVEKLNTDSRQRFQTPLRVGRSRGAAGKELEAIVQAGHKTNYSARPRRDHSARLT